MTRAAVVLDPGTLCTVQDRGRAGYASLGVPPSGAADLAAHDLANRLVGNAADAATLEVTMGGLRLRAETDLVLAVAGARCPGVDHHAVVHAAAGSQVTLGRPAAGLRSYVAVRGGWDVPPVLGSRSTDVLSGLGPAPVRAWQRLAVGTAAGRPPPVELAPVPEPGSGPVVVELLPGPRASWFTADAWSVLQGTEWGVQGDSNRIAVRLDGPDRLSRARTEELLSEGVVRGAVQVPPSGRPLVFLADHPVTGGYPVIGYVRESDLGTVAQVRAGQRLRFRIAPWPGPAG